MFSISNEARGSLYAILSGLCYGLVGYLGITLINSGLSVATMCFWRFGIASLLCLIFLIYQYKQITNNISGALKVFFFSSIFFGGDALLYFEASTYIGTGLACIIFFTYPVFVILIERILYNNRINKIYQTAMVVILFGMWLLIDIHGVNFDILGVTLSVASAIFYACYVVACKKAKLPPLASTFSITSGCAAMCLIVALVEGSFAIPTLNISTWSGILAISIACTIIPTFALIKSLQYISSDKASILSVFEPIFILLLGVTLLGETIHMTQAAGAAIILTGAMMTIVKEYRIVLPILHARKYLFDTPIPQKYIELEV